MDSVTDSDINQQIYAEQVALLYRNSFAGATVTLIVGGVLVGIQSTQFTIFTLAQWYLGLISVAVFRLILAYRYHRAQPSVQCTKLWERRFLIGTGLAGLSWGSAALILFPYEAFIFQVFLAFVLGGMIAGAVGIFSARITAFVLFAVPIASLTAGQFFINGAQFGTGMGILWLVYVAGMIIISKNINRSLRATLNLRYDNQLLIAEIGERRRVEQALRASEERFRDFAESAADWFWEMDTDLKYTHLSDRFQEITGLRQIQIIGRSPLKLFTQHSKDTVLWESYIKTLRAKKPFENCEIRWRTTDGILRTLLISGKPIYDSQGNFQGYRGVGRDATQERRLLRTMTYQASHDPLTGLVNRREFIRRLENAVLQAKRDETPCVICYLDLDRFKIVNDTAGHKTGDELLKQITGILLSRIRARDTLSRFGGDEFGLLLENCPLDTAAGIAETLLAALNDFRFTWEDRIFRIGVSIGLVPITAMMETAEQSLTQADQACYIAKRRGRNRVHIFREEDSAFVQHEAELTTITELRKALEEDRFKLYYQSAVRLVGHSKLPYFEALLRLQQPTGEVILPSAFLPAAERYGIMLDIDRWVIVNALHAYRETFGNDWCAIVGINLSGYSLVEEQMTDFIHQQLTKFELDPKLICFEIRETAAIRNLNLATQFITDLKAIGFRFALDNLGGSLTSMTYLKHLPVDYLKIDGTVVQNISADTTERAMVAAINKFSHEMNIETVAEGVESKVILKQLKALGIDYAQGFALQVPTPHIIHSKCTRCD